MTADLGKCNLFNKTSGGGDPFHIADVYGGIPQNLVTNLIALSALILLFLVLRKSAWKVVNKIVNKDDVHKWTLLFFSFTSTVVQTIDQDIIKGGRKPKSDEKIVREEQPIACVQESSRSPPANPGEFDADISMPEDNGEATPSPGVPHIQRQASLLEGMSYWAWLGSIFTAPDAHVFEMCGNDAVQYLRFQKHVIAYLMVLMVFAICVVLPLNFQGNLYGDVTSFGHTTLANLDPDSDYLWVHLFLAFLFFPMSIMMMRRFSVDLKFTQVNLEMNRTVMISKIPKSACRSKQEIKRYFEEAFPHLEITEIRFAYDVRQLQKLHDNLAAAISAHQFCVRNGEFDKKPMSLHPVQCSRWCSCFCCCCVHKEEGLEFYESEESKLEEEFSKEKDVALRSPVGVAFVTFKSLAMSMEVFDTFQKSFFQFVHKAPCTSVSSMVKPYNWVVTFAPERDDIYWENLHGSPRFLTMKYVAVNIALFLFLLFLTTPEVVLAQLSKISTKLDVAHAVEVLQLPSAIVDFVPTLMVWGVTALVPLLVAWSDRFLGHWTRSEENHSIMWKTFWYLLFMVVFLPTFGFTSLQASIEFVVNGKNETYRWECLFLPDSGAFFVNYAITAALVGAGLELIRFPDLVWYVVQLCWSRSAAEAPHIRESTMYEFRFGEQYARIMMLFCMTVMYCISCPMITPFGTMFFIMKHFVDKHNLMYAYKPSKINKKVHATAISYVVLATVILQFFMMVFSIVRNGTVSEMSIRSKIAIGFFLVSVNIFSAQLWVDTCRKFSPIEYFECTYVRDDQELDAGLNEVYLPEMLMMEEELMELRRNRRAGEIRERTRKASSCHEV